MREFGHRNPDPPPRGTLGLILLHALAASLALVPDRLPAQEIVGEIVDDARRAVTEVSIGLFDTEGTLVATTRSDERGGFTVTAPEEGLYRLNLNRLGYGALSGGPYALDSGMRLEVFVVMHRTPTEIEPLEVEVEGRSARLSIRGFYERRDAGLGYFLDREEIERVSMMHLADVVGRIPRLRVDPRANILGADAVRNPGIVFEKGGAPCVPALWVDGVLVKNGGSRAPPLRIDDYVSQGDAEGIEFYGGAASAPIEFSHSAACAVLVVWTRGPGGASGGR